jgi:Leucine-rich repeat (LRR) protein
MPIPMLLLQLVRENHPEIIKLELGGHDLRDSDIPILCDVLQANTVVRSIDLRGNLITDEGIQYLATHSLGRTFQLDLSCNRVKVEGWRFFALHNTTITQLIVTASRLGDEGAVALAGSKCVHSLDLSANDITDHGAEALAKNEVLEELFLNHNKITGYGARKLFQSHTLRVLYLAHNQVEEVDEAVLSQNTTLHRLNIDANPLTRRMVILLAQQMSLQSLSLRSLALTDADVSIFASISQTLIALYLGGNKLTDVGARQLLLNSQLKEISMPQNALYNVPSFVRR